MPQSKRRARAAGNRGVAPFGAASRDRKPEVTGGTDSLPTSDPLIDSLDGRRGPAGLMVAVRPTDWVGPRRSLGFQAQGAQHCSLPSGIKIQDVSRLKLEARLCCRPCGFICLHTYYSFKTELFISPMAQ
jgi:hypothetical protein